MMGCNKLTYRISWACDGGCGSWSCSPHGLELECRKARMRARSIWLWMSMFFPIGSARLLHAPLGKREEADFYVETNQRALKLNPLLSLSTSIIRNGSILHHWESKLWQNDRTETMCIYESSIQFDCYFRFAAKVHIIWQQTSEEETFWRWPFQSQMSELQSPPGYLLLAKQFQSKCN
jgi:hypothetical protein